MEATANLLHLSIAIIGALLVALFFGWSKLYYLIRGPGEGTHQGQAALSPAPSLDSDAYLRRRSVEVPTDKSLPVRGSPHTDKSLSNHELKYHVFLSFRGEDTRFKFTDHLYGALCRAGINTFRDQEELRTGDKIRPALLDAIDDSRISVIVLSKNYAYSSWCLDELVKILECRKLMNQVVLPIFYEVDPSEVRHQTGSFWDSMAGHEKRFKDNIEKVEKWRSALRKVANLSGESYTKESEFEFIGKIIQKISIILDNPLLHLPKQVVGLESRKLIVLSLLSIEPNDLDVSIVGIYGTGGVGKTTIAKAVYNSVATQFESTSFCSDVQQNTTKHGLAHVQRSILVDMLGNNDINLHNPHRGISVIKERLQNKRVLLVLDNVDKLKQLQSLAGGCDWFGPGSRVIITARDKQLLIRHGVEKIYEVQELDKEALNLLCWNAFRSNEPKIGFEDVSMRVLSYARGIPLALEIIGSHFYEKDVEEWESAIDAYRKNMDSEIFGILKVSYESLEYNEKEIFLDVACFFVGTTIEYVEEILEGCGFSSKSGLSILEDRCLVKRQKGVVWMHDLTQSMGREIVRRESEREPWERSRIWFHEDALKVLTRDMGTGKIEGLVLEFPHENEVVWSGKAFEKMVNLRILIIRNAIFSEAPKELPNSLRVLEWENYPSSSLPSNFHGNELLELQLKNATQIVEIQEPFKMFQNITRLVIAYCDRLKEVPDVSAVPNLASLWIFRCRSLVKIHDSLGSLDNFKELVICYCVEVNKFPAWNQFKSLLCLFFKGCEKLSLTKIGGIQTTLNCIGLYDVDIDFRSGLIQEMMDHQYSVHYHFSGSRISRCFCYRSNQNSISFWIQKTFPDVHVGFSFKGSNQVDQKLNLRLSIGPLKAYHVATVCLSDPTTDIFLLPRSLSYEDYLMIQEMLIRLNCWVRVDISFVTSPDNPPASADRNQDPDALVTECGVYVSPTCDANFSFVNPYRPYSIKNKSFAGRLVENGVLPMTTVEKKDAVSSSDLLWKKIISLNVSLQVKHFAWTAISDHLISKWSLEEKGSRNGCHICGKRNVKIDFHFLKNCEWARGVWLLSPLGLRVDRMEANNLLEWMQKLERILDNESLELFLVIAWGLWSEWDKLCMGLKIEDPPTLIRRMCLLLQDYRITHRPMNQCKLTDADVALYRLSSIEHGVQAALLVAELF